jgi:rhodanese-related sulfurtransferase
MIGDNPSPSRTGAIGEVPVAIARRMLRAGGELAMIDVREAGEFAAGHPFFAISAPFSRFEPELLRLVPNPAARVLLVGADEDGRAMRAARIALRLGYGNVGVLAGGAAGWRAAGYELFEGENVPSKAFGELLLETRGVPSVSAAELEARRRRGETILLLDGRPFEEHRKMCVPGSVSLPNGDLAYRIGLALPDEKTPVLVHCAGRTRGILGAETLRNLGLKNPVAALEDGTQGWCLAGLPLERGSERRIDATPDSAARATQKRRAAELAARWAVPRPGVETVLAWSREAARTTYMLDVRSPEEFAAGRASAAIQNAPGGQLVQATDRWLAVRGARVVLVDDTEIRAVVTAHWLRQMGWDAMALAGGSDAWPALAALSSPRLQAPPSPPSIAPAALAARLAAGEVALLDLRPSGEFREAHVEGARWTTRGRLPDLLRERPPREAVIIASDPMAAGLAAVDLGELAIPTHQLGGGPAAWRAAGLTVVRTPVDPPDRERIDFVAFMHDRHAGNAEASRGYLAWEKGLVGRLDRDERASFRIAPAEGCR